VRINASGLKDRKFAEDMVSRGAEIERKAIDLETQIMKIVNDKISTT
jgi:glutamate formiminotransferase/formiminotetrahydrofolate cyclodeaminase